MRPTGRHSQPLTGSRSPVRTHQRASLQQAVSPKVEAILRQSCGVVLVGTVSCAVTIQAQVKLFEAHAYLGARDIPQSASELAANNRTGSIFGNHGSYE